MRVTALRSAPARFPLFVCLLLAVLTASADRPAAQTASGAIRLNQIGFYPSATKVAVVVGAPEGVFSVLTADGATAVYTGALGPAQTWSPSGESVRLADFSAVQAPGLYRLDVPGTGQSHPFGVAAGVHHRVARAALRGYYYQRVSVPLVEPHAAGWTRPAGHAAADRQARVHASAASPDRPTNTIIAAPRGWYDAGDYNKYVVNSGITMGTLLGLYEHYPAYYDALDLNIPESANGVPDVLDEVLWNLRWMLAMQDPADGGVYHKHTNANFDGFVMPHEATSLRYVVQKGTAATLDFAAVAAQAARIYAPYTGELPGLADSLSTAALAAWRWARANPSVAYNQAALNQAFDPDINTGEYGDGSFDDELDWAAMELFVTTRADSFLTAARPTQPIQMSVPYWGNVRQLGYYSLLHHRRALGASVDTTALKASMVALANTLRAARSRSAYGVVMGGSSGDFVWGSNAVAANQGIALMAAYRLTADRTYRDAALSNLDYVLGRNAVGLSFLTGHGDAYARNIHHRPSIADGIAEPVPGLLAGGPNPGLQDQANCAREGVSYPSTLAALAYVDHRCSYSSNEIAINWNAPLAYLAGALEAALSPNGLPTAAEPSGEGPFAPERLELESYPNPFRTRATIRFRLARPGIVTVEMLDLLGRSVGVLAEGEVRAAGLHEVSFEAGALASGMYLCRVTTPSHTATRSITLFRKR